MLTRKEMGEWIKQSRMRKDISQKDLAEQLGIHRSELSMIENGKVLFPSKLTQKLSVVFEVKPEFIANKLADIAHRDIFINAGIIVEN